MAAKGVFRLESGEMLHLWQDVPGLWASDRESTDTDG